MAIIVRILNRRSKDHKIYREYIGTSRSDGLSLIHLSSNQYWGYRDDPKETPNMRYKIIDLYY
jgi:hypothetical protein